MKSEAEFQTKFNRWCKNRAEESFAYELKLCKRKSIPFNAIEKHQKEYLFLVKHGTFPYKIPDVGLAQRPFDGFCFVKSPAYIGIMFHKRGQKEFILIDIDNFLNEEKTSERKSLTEEKAKQIGKLCFLS
jgi:penicillin-binding protein-related factor A (putative recombinase)